MCLTLAVTSFHSLPLNFNPFMIRIASISQNVLTRKNILTVKLYRHSTQMCQPAHVATVCLAQLRSLWGKRGAASDASSPKHPCCVCACVPAQYVYGPVCLSVWEYGGGLTLPASLFSWAIMTSGTDRRTDRETQRGEEKTDRRATSPPSLQVCGADIFIWMRRSERQKTPGKWRVSHNDGVKLMSVMHPTHTHSAAHT